MRWSINHTINIGFGVALLILSIVGVAAYRSTIGLVEASDAVAHTHHVIEKLESVFSQLKDIETGERGYIITGRPSYLEQYNIALGQIDQDLGNLRSLTADNPDQQRRFDALEPLIIHKLAFMRGAVDARTTHGFEAAAQELLTDEGKGLMDQIRQLIDQMEAEEHRLLEQRDAQARASAYSTEAIIVAGSLLTFGLVALAILIIRRDMDRRRRAEAKLSESEEQFRQLAENIDQIFWMATLDLKRMIYVSPTYERVWGCTCASLYERPQSFFDAIHPDDRDRVIASQANKAQGGYDEEYRIIRPDGSVRWIWARAFPVRDAAGAAYRIAGISVDITDRKKIDQMKNEFISVVSHELRTPLTSIRGSLGLIAGGVVGQVPPKARTMIDIAYKNSERLVRLINDILDIEKIESGKMAFDMKPVRLARLVEQVIEANRAYAAEVSVTFAFEHSLPDVNVLADSDRLAQVLTNLFSNAAKFSPPGDAVNITMSRQGHALRISVADHGPGIPAEFQAQIFQKFAQADTSDTRQKGGTGLGLSISKAIVEKLGGQIGFETAAGAGTTFYFDLPEWRPAPAIAGGRAQERPRVLICEDDPDIALLLGLMLGQGGFSSDVAMDAAQAKQMLAQRPYAAMTLDIMLPGQDGVALIRELSEHEATRNLPIVVVSARADPSRCELNGSAVAVIDWLDKPIDQQRLINAVRRATGPMADGKPYILHVEDDPDIVQVVGAIVADIATTASATSLREARRRLTQEVFDLVILDPGLPDGSGLELLPLLHHEGRSPIPVVMFSAAEPHQEIAQHIDTVLVKSRTSNQKLLDTIAALITRDREPAAG